MITSKFLLSVMSLKFEYAVNGKGKAKTDKASPPCFISSRLDIFFVSVTCFYDVCRFLKLHITFWFGEVRDICVPSARTVADFLFKVQDKIF